MQYSPHAWLTTGFVTRVTQRVPHVEQEMFTFFQRLSWSPVFSGLRVVQSFVFCVSFYISLFVILSFFILTIVLSVFRFTTSNYLSDIFKLLLQKYIHLVLVDITAGRLFTHQDISSTVFRTSVLTGFQTFYLRNYLWKLSVCVLLVKQELLTFLRRLSSSPFCWARVAQSLVFYALFITVYLFVPFLLAIVLSVISIYCFWLHIWYFQNLFLHHGGQIV